MKKITVLLTALVCGISLLAGCGAKPAERELYNLKLSKYVTVGDYDGLSVNTGSDDYKTNYDAVISGDVSDNDLYVRKTEGQVADGDTVNIDYTGTKDGVAFEGGTATDSDLEIGSNSFIEGFESGLIGVNIGDTVDLNLTFPADYQTADLAGKAVVFNVKVNYVKTDEERKPEDYYKELSYKTLDAYTDNVTERAIKSYHVDTVKKKSKTISYPEDDQTLLYEAMKNQYETMYQNQYGMSLTDVLSYSGSDETTFKKDLLENAINPMMDEQMVLYSIADAEKLGVTEKDAQKQIDLMLKSYEGSSVTADNLTEYFGKYYFESLAVKEKVENLLYESAKIK